MAIWSTTATVGVVVPEVQIGQLAKQGPLRRMQLRIGGKDGST